MKSFNIKYREYEILIDSQHELMKGDVLDSGHINLKKVLPDDKELPNGRYTVFLRTFDKDNSMPTIHLMDCTI